MDSMDSLDFHFSDKMQNFDVHINLASCGILGGNKHQPQLTKRARLNTSIDWKNPPIKPKFDRNLQKVNLQERNL